MSVLSKTPPATLAAACADIMLPEDAVDLRKPEIGAVMVRGRMGATGDAFNLGEVSVTRGAVRLDDGTIGFSYVQGRDQDHARKAAIIDALMQTERKAELEAAIIAPLEALILSRHSKLQSKADATRVDFFTMVRGE